SSRFGVTNADVIGPGPNLLTITSTLLVNGLPSGGTATISGIRLTPNFGWIQVIDCSCQVVIENVVTDGSRNSGVYQEGGNVLIRNSEFKNGWQTSTYGGGISVQKGSLTIENSKITGNYGEYGGGGLGVRADANANVTVRNTIISNNTVG